MTNETHNNSMMDAILAFDNKITILNDTIEILIEKLNNEKISRPVSQSLLRQEDMTSKSIIKHINNAIYGIESLINITDQKLCCHEKWRIECNYDPCNYNEHYCVKCGINKKDIL